MKKKYFTIDDTALSIGTYNLVKNHKPEVIRPFNAWLMIWDLSLLGEMSSDSVMIEGDILYIIGMEVVFSI